MKHIKDIQQPNHEQYAQHEQNDLRFEQLMQRIDHAEAEKTNQKVQTTEQTGWFERVKTWLLGETAPAFRYAALAMATLLVGQTIYIVATSQHATVTYHAASGEQPTAAVSTAAYLVIFTPSADIQGISTLLQKTNARLINGPESDNTYIIHFSQAPANDILIQYEKSQLVEFIGETE